MGALDAEQRVQADDLAPVEPPHELATRRGAVGESWTYYYWLAVVLEVILLAVILRLAWTWPRRTTSPAATATSLDATATSVDAEPLRMQRQA